MIGNEISDEHAGHDADAAEADQGESQTRCEGPSCAQCRNIHIPTVGSAAGVTSEYCLRSTPDLGEPYARHLGGTVRELRFHQIGCPRTPPDPRTVQVELAARADMTQPALSRLEARGGVPTIPLLERISAALDADLIVQLAPHAA